MTRPLKVAYILLYFPRLTETFVAEEIRSLRKYNVDIIIVSLLSAKYGPVQAVSQELLQHAWQVPGLLTLAVWKAQFHFLLKSGRLYLRLLATLLGQPYPYQPLRSFLKRLVIFLKAVAVASRLESCGIDLIHAHFAWLPGVAAWICARLLGKPFTVTVHAYEIYSQRKDLLRLVSREAAHVVAISKYNQLQVAALKTCPEEAVSVIHCGIDLAKFDEPSEMRKGQPIGGTIRILSVGSLVAKKGHEDLIEACRLINEKGLKFTCTIIGGGPDEHVLQQKIREYNLEGRVRLSGSRTQVEIIKAYYQHDLFVLASKVASDGDRDGIPVVLMEAGMAGLPIISTSVSGIPELIQHKQTGWLVPPGDATSLADAIVVVAGDPGLRARLRQNIRALVGAQFNIKTSTLQLADLFQKTCKRWKH